EKSRELSFTLSDIEADGEGSAVLKSYDFVIKNTDKISLRVSFEYCAYLYSTDRVSYLSDIESSGERSCLNSPQLTLYFADKNENVWDIAKSFSTDVDLIMQENELSSEIIDAKRVLLVPGM
ncbi:MAG: LysM peptidoglycan-binding domain-containing protein, partial [Eubacterium sp.]